MGLIFATSKWADALWAGHCQASRMARQILLTGTDKQAKFGEFANDVHAALYLRHEPQRHDEAPEWATSLLDQAYDLAEYTNLRARCARNGLAAGVACETLLGALLPLLPEAPKRTPSQTRQRGQDGTPGTGQESGAGPGAQPTSEDASAVRRALRQALRQAQDAVEEAEASTEAMAEAMGLQAGTGPGHAETLRELDQIRQLWALIRDNPTMRHIAEMAGRLQRLGQAHKRCQVTPAVGRIKGITVGGDLDRLLPAELAGLRSTNRLQRLSTLSKIMGNRAMQYELSGTESLTKGPVIVLVDESGSMQGNGKQEWSKAVALALLTLATQQKRTCFLAGFDVSIRHEHLFRPQTMTVDDVCQALTAACSGGTDFNVPLRRALQVLHVEPAMNQADIVIVTDGEATIDDDVLAAIATAQEKANVHLYGVLIGRGARGESLKHVAATLYRVQEAPQQDSEKVAPLLAQV